MLQEFVQKILDLAGPRSIEINGLPYADGALHLVADPPLSCVALLTLTGLADLVRHRTDALAPDSYLLHVVSHAEVALVQKQTDEYGRRVCLARVKLDDGHPFSFGRFLDREEFVIGLQSRFVASPDLVETLKIASNLEASTVVQSEDDGISQRTTVKQGVQLKEVVKVKGRVVLRPYRTFREVEQPGSEFVFRLRSDNGAIPHCALFEADGGKWKLDAVLAIKAWLDGQALDIPVIA